MTETPTTLTGSCNCKGITFTVRGEVPHASACHCGQCRKQSGNVWASAPARLDQIDIVGDVRWYQSSPKAKRGFCPTCGAFLFWKPVQKDKMSFALGAIDGPTGLKITRHIYTADKGDYYDIADGVPQT